MPSGGRCVENDRIKYMNKIDQLKKLVKEECFKNNREWFYKTHLIQVEKFAKILLKKLPKADKETVMLAVWCHDLQRVRNLKGDHEKVGAREAAKTLKEFGYDDGVIERIKEIISHHSGNDPKKIKTLEGKILVSADAMSHYHNDFFLKIAVMAQRDIEQFKKWSLEKLNRNYNKKIFFPFAKKMIKKRHDALMYIFTMK